MDDVKGKLVNRKRIAVEDDQLSSLSQLKLCMNDSTTNRCDVYFRIHDKAIDRVVDLKSRFKMPLNKDVIDTLNDMEINYEVNF